MKYNKLVSVTGMSGLYELVSSKADGGIVKSLEDNSSKFVSNRVHQFSHLESIEIFTVNDNVNLVDVFVAMQNNEKELPDVGDTKALKTYFAEVYPDMDLDRVYTSDMKKMVKWFDILKKNDVEIKLSSADDAEAATDDKAATADKKSATKATASAKPATLKNAPAKKINSPRKMA